MTTKEKLERINEQIQNILAECDCELVAFECDPPGGVDDPFDDARAGLFLIHGYLMGMQKKERDA